MEKLQEQIPKEWLPYINMDYLEQVDSFLEKESTLWHPKTSQIFRALELTKPSGIKIIQISMDPYPTKNVPNGLAFSVNPGMPIPKSLVNIFKEYHDDLGYPIPESGDLTTWAENGCLLLNSALTCRIGEPGSHMKTWEPFSKHLLKQISERHKGLVFILLGANAQSRVKDLDLGNHYIIEAPHPSPLSAYRGFFGSKIFSRSNQYLAQEDKKPIKWKLI